MLVHPHPRDSVGLISFAFERLPIALGACYGTAVGTAHIAYDGHGTWWVTQVEISSPREPGPSTWLPVNSPLYIEIRDRLAQYRGEDIDARIERDLAAGRHMTLFDEHPPHPIHRRAPPPHARRTRAATARAGIVAAEAARLGIELVCIALLLAGIACAGMVRTPAHGPRRLAPAALATLETGDRP